MIPLVYWLIGGLAGGAYYMQRKRKHGMTPERAIVYETALRTVKDPTKLRALATAFRKEGLNSQADMLEKRAKLRELPPDLKAKRQQAYRDGMKSTDPDKVETLAAAFESEGATGAADSLRKYAKGLRDAAKNPPPPPPPAPTAPVSVPTVQAAPPATIVDTAPKT